MMELAFWVLIALITVLNSLFFTEHALNKHGVTIHQKPDWWQSTLMQMMQTAGSLLQLLVPVLAYFISGWWGVLIIFGGFIAVCILVSEIIARNFKKRPALL